MLEMRLLSYFMHHVGRIVSQSELMEHMYAMDEAPDSNTIEVVIARLRRKVGREVLQTVRGLGYRFG